MVFEQRRHPEGVYARTITRRGQAVTVYDAVAEGPRKDGEAPEALEARL